MLDTPSVSPEALTALVGEVLQRTPEWVRRDLGSADPMVRSRAEDTLAGMIAAVLPARA